MKDDELDNRPLDSLNKKELEALKLKTEILKLQSEIAEQNRWWIVKNASFLIPSLIGLATIITGIATGYFDVESKVLEIKKHDLTVDIASFQQRKDTLNKKNKALSIINNNLSKETYKLKTDNSKLSDSVKDATVKVLTLSTEKTKLNNQISTIDEQRKKLNDDLNKSFFKNNLSRFLNSPGMNNDGYSDLRLIVTKNDPYHQYYLNTITNIIDTTKNVFHKGVLMCLMYDVENNPIWKEKLFNLGNTVCAEINTGKTKDEGIWSFFSIFSNYQLLQPKRKEDRLELIDYLISIIRKIRNSNYNNNDGIKTSILFNLSFMGSVSRDLIDHDSESFCYLIKICNTYCFNEINGGYIPDGIFAFLRDNAPIALLCVYSEIMQNRKNYSTQSLNQFQAKVYDIFDTNKNIDKPSDITSPEKWKEWQQKHFDLVNIERNVYNYVDNKSDLKRLLEN